MNDSGKLSRWYRRAVQLAPSKGFGSIALPAISTGV
ncbi:MAG: macro domain-containing protein [Azonexus sp.]|nr:macro domain-containing protein [Dechloromonas sp.]MBP8194537.1 macro domain-containing protein [Azonexus sp.]